MHEIVFAKTRYVYDSYKDFFKLVELSEYPICFVDEIDVTQEKIYITTPINGEIRPHIDNHRDKNRNCHIISWNLERPNSSEGMVGQYGKDNRELMYKRYVDEIWVSDRQLALETGLRYVTLGSHYGLGEPAIDKLYHAVHMSYVVPRRQTIYSQINNLAPNGWDEEKHKSLQQSFFAINVHQDQFPFVEPLRFALFAAYGLPVISEYIANSDPYWDTVIWCDYADIPQKLNEFMGQNYKRFRDLGLEFRDLLCNEYGFRKMIEHAINTDGLIWR